MRKWPLPRIVIAIIGLSGTAIAFVAIAAANGVIGNGASDLVRAYTTPLLHFIGANWKLLLLLLIGLLISLLILFILTRTLSKLSHQVGDLSKQIAGLTTEVGTLRIRLQGSDQWFELADSSLRLIPSLICANDLDSEMRRFIKKLLAGATRVFLQVYGASLFLPDPAKQELTIWEHYQVPADSALRARCYIGPETGRKRGIAGEAYVKRAPVLTHITEERDEHGQWKFDNNEYLPFTDEGTYPAFRSFICVPIIVGPGPDDCLGAVCVDSMNIAAFDSTDAQEILMRLGRHVGAALLIYRELQKRQSSN